MNDTAPTLHAGVAQSDITTDDPNAAIHDRLYAKAIVLDDQTTRLAIVSMDAVAIGGICDIPDDFLLRLRTRIEDQLGIPGQHVMVHATHTHPPGRLLCDDDQQVERTLDAVRRAQRNLTPVRVGFGWGREERIAINRTLRLKDGRHWTIRQTNPCPNDDAVESLGPIDPRIGVLRFDKCDTTNGSNNSLLAVVYNFACHPLIGVPGGAVTANYPGFASHAIETRLGDDAIAIFLQGAAGDITERDYKDTNRPRDSKPIGEMLGCSTLDAWQNITVQNGELAIESQTVRFPHRTDIPDRLAELHREQRELLASLRFTSLNFKSFMPLYLKHLMSPDHPGDYAYRYLQSANDSHMLRAMDTENRLNIDKYLENINAMEKLARIEDKIATLERHQAIIDESHQCDVEAELHCVRIGTCAIVFAPIEVLSQVAMNVQAASPFEHTIIAAFSNGYLHYGPAADDYDGGGYEVTECFVGPGWQAIFESTVQSLLERLYVPMASTR